MNVSNINSFLLHIMFSLQSNLNISTTWSLFKNVCCDRVEQFNPVTTHVLRLWSLLLVHQPGPLLKSLIALFSTLHLTSGINSPPNFVSPARYCLLYVHLLSHTAVHLHCHHFHHVSPVHSFTLNLRLVTVTESLRVGRFFWPRNVVKRGICPPVSLSRSRVTHSRGHP